MHHEFNLQNIATAAIALALAFVFACSNSDRGMPERRMPKPVEPMEEIPVVETELVDDATEE